VDEQEVNKIAYLMLKHVVGEKYTVKEILNARRNSAKMASILGISEEKLEEFSRVFLQDLFRIQKK